MSHFLLKKAKTFYQSLFDTSSSLIYSFLFGEGKIINWALCKIIWHSLFKNLPVGSLLKQHFRLIQFSKLSRLECLIQSSCKGKRNKLTDYFFVESGQAVLRRKFSNNSERRKQASIICSSVNYSKAYLLFI